MPDIDSVREGLEALCLKFEKDKTHYLSRGYPESQVRIDFLDPLFNILGWDIANTAQKPPHERDVIVEASSEATGRPDYNFRIKGVTKFFVEAKSPLTNLSDARHILQAKSYAWSTKGVFFVILTNYAEFKLFDASLKPNERFPEEGLIYSLKYMDYLSNIGKLLDLSKERVEEGSLEALIPKDLKSKRLRIPPDKSFLVDLTVWRSELAKDIHKRNPEFDVKLLNDVVQKLLDRIIFIRIAEDRNIRQNRELWEIVAQWKGEGRRKPIMANLKNLFYRINDDLNGNIFKPHACEEADIDSGLLAEIIENLYAPKSQYRFDAIGVELLGSIYERYLGSTIRVTPQRVKVEEKPEVRKAGGVYYTPKYIVDYIVKNTVGRVIEGKTPKQIEKIRILDPACGSGSFLLGAYQYLIDYHLKYYREHPKQARVLYYDPYYKIKPDEITLPIQEKARILKNNLFGVDKDPQAVEITMMSLYLKAIEGERGFLPMRQHLLPPLTYNIICGNSLVGYDMFEGLLFDDGTKDEVNPFDWSSKAAGFGEIMESGGFDVVIGNPPYVRQELLHSLKDYFQTHYKVYHGTADLYAYFVEKGISLLRNGGYFSYIVANKWMRANYDEPLRKWLKEQNVEEIVDFGDLPVFETATTYPCILRVRKAPAAKSFRVAQVKTLDFENLSNYVNEHSYTVNKSALTEKGWSLTDERSQALLDKLITAGIPLGEYVKGKIFYGIKTGLNEAFVIDAETKDRLIAEDPQSAELIKHFLFGRDVKRYEPPVSSRYLIFTRRGTDIKQYPAIHKYLLSFKDHLTPKPKDFTGDVWKGRKPGSYKWYEIQDAVDYYEEFEKPKIVYAEIATRGQFALDTDSFYADTTVYIMPTDSKYLLGILNSRVFAFIFSKISSEIRGGFYRWKRQYMLNIPVPAIDFADPSQKTTHDGLISLVDSMLDLHKKAHALPASSERDRIEREIALTDEKIDWVAYKLYGVTEAERKIVEGSALESSEEKL
jgi:type I restriction-modification system DNA methylase subunit